VSEIISGLPAVLAEPLPGQSPNKLRQRYLERRDRLQAKVKAGTATVEDRVNLGECLVRLRQYPQAIEVLTPVAGRDCRDFRVLANLATANQYNGELQRASDYLDQAISVWPKQWPGLSAEQLAWYRRAELLHRSLLRLRNREALQAARLPPGERLPSLDTVDALFKDPKGQPVRFVGEGGQYEAGKLAEAEKAKLPPDALALVQQLLVWMPDDTRLYWLLGELLNARGDVEDADKVFEDCVYSRRYPAAELQEHRRVVREARAELKSGDDLVAAAPPPDAWMPGRQQLVVVIGLSGVLLGFLGYLQVREIRRRRGEAVHRRG
jgi:tetratricopeptide (TPR) repeat protein